MLRIADGGAAERDGRLRVSERGKEREGRESVCVCERETKRERQRQRERERERERERGANDCVYTL